MGGLDTPHSCDTSAPIPTPRVSIPASSCLSEATSSVHSLAPSSANIAKDPYAHNVLEATASPCFATLYGGGRFSLINKRANKCQGETCQNRGLPPQNRSCRCGSAAGLQQPGPAERAPGAAGVTDTPSTLRKSGLRQLEGKVPLHAHLPPSRPLGREVPKTSTRDNTF